MLDSETKRRIDSARDILVGKVPDPKSQVEQITIALIYKFMDDMDAEAEELGGKRSFFVGEYKKFSWAKLLSPALSGYDMLNLYGESIDKMTRNQGVPQLFRDIFKNAYLPYRDPETLKMFLKVINDFNYDHSEKLGDAFEYLLSVLGSQGDAGQFRTPRHIIDFMVKVVDPQKDETILDPACGTAGFLISAYKHVMASNAKDGKPGGALKPAERKKLADNIRGYDISPDMVRLSLVNLYLHGFTTPNIFEYDTLASEERWNDTADVILANPPFMSPKGGIMPHKKFSVQSNRSEVLFVDYMAEHLTPNGRAAIIVPEGIIFQSAGAYKQLRKYLIEHNFLWAVVSLPAGAFNPYSGVKTSILFLDKSLAKKTDKVLFVKVENDGFDLGAQRRPIDRNDLPETLRVLKTLRVCIQEGKTASFSPEADTALLVSISKLAETGDYNLSADRYREVIKVNHHYEMVKLSDVCLINPKKSEVNELDSDTLVSFIPMEDIDEHRIEVSPKRERKIGEVYKGYTYFKDNDVLVAKVTPCFENGKGGIARNLVNGIGFGTSELYVLRATEKVIPEYIYWIINREDFVQKGKDRMTGTGGLQRVPSDYVANYQIPLPPLEIQRQLVDEIAAHQHIIDGARQVVESWKPSVEINSEWKSVNLGDIAEFKNGVNFTKESKGKSVKILGVRHFQDHTIAPLNDLDEVVAEANFDKSHLLQEGDILFVRSNGNKELVGRSIMIPKIKEDITFSGFTIRCRLNKKAYPLFYAYLFKTDFYRNILKQVGVGANINNLSQGVLKEIKIPLPPLEIQREIVARIETERAIVHGNRELIRLYEEKVKKVIERVWEG
ncbi:MAG: restriction endonuclease subunit M/S [Anaerolineaceae bacterium]|nr:MAG: restriction endonuclease subunit M/S [Anaerolineaceae bacterium]